MLRSTSPIKINNKKGAGDYLAFFVGSGSMPHFCKQLHTCLQGKLVVPNYLNDQVWAKQTAWLQQREDLCRVIYLASQQRELAHMEVGAAGLLPVFKQSRGLHC